MHFYQLLSVLLASILLISCRPAFVKNKEAWQDANSLEECLAAQTQIKNKIKPDGETAPVYSLTTGEDSADDPAIWYNEISPEKSIIYGSNKLYGIHGYTLAGEEVQFLDYDKINNIDVRSKVRIGTALVDILGASNVSNRSIDLFVIQENGNLSPQPSYQISLGDFTPYGFCLHRTRDAQLHAFVNEKSGKIRQYKISINTENELESKPIQEWKLATQCEGMVADDHREMIYIGEEQKGIHYFSTNPEVTKRSSFISQSTDSNKFIRYDIEGLAFLAPHYLIASSQGNFSYAIFDTRSMEYVTSFVIADGLVDGAEETDGIDILTRPMGSDFTQGIFVVQDGYNYQNDQKSNQNFKLINVQKIKNLLENTEN